MAFLSINNTDRLEKSRSQVRRYSIGGANVNPGGPGYFLPLDIFTAKGDLPIKISKVMANIQPEASEVVSFVAYIFQGTEPPIVINQPTLVPADIFFPYSWPLVNSDPIAGIPATGNPNADKIKAFCLPGTCMVIGLQTNDVIADTFQGGLEIEIKRIMPDEY